MSALETASLTIKGARAELRVADGIVSIHREGDTVTAPTNVEFPIGRVRGTSLEAPKRGGRGWLHVSVIGGTPAPVGEMGAMSDPYALPITSRALGGCKRLGRLVERHLQEHGLPSDRGPNDGHYTSGVVVTRAPAADPDNASASASQPESSSGDDAAAARQRAAKKAVAKKTVAKKTVAKGSGPKVVAGKPGAGNASVKGRATSANDGARRPKDGSAGMAGQELVDQLRQLGELHSAGVLSDAEFVAAKQRILS